MKASDAVVGDRGSRQLDVGYVLHCSSAGSHVIWVGDMGYVPAHWQYLGCIPPHGGLQTDGEATTEKTGWDVCVTPDGGYDCGGGHAEGGDLCHPPPEHSRTVHCDRAHFGPVSGGVSMPWDRGV